MPANLPVHTIPKRGDTPKECLQGFSSRDYTGAPNDRHGFFESSDQRRALVALDCLTGVPRFIPVKHPRSRVSQRSVVQFQHDHSADDSAIEHLWRTLKFSTLLPLRHEETVMLYYFPYLPAMTALCSWHTIVGISET